MKARWEHFDDGPRTGVRGFGSTPAEAFEQAALALAATMADPGRVGAWEAVSLQCEAPDEERLLGAWLALLAGEAASRQLVFSRLEVRIDGRRLSARAWGEQMDLRHRRLPRVVDGPLLRFGRHGDGWLAQAVVELGDAPARREARPA